MSLVPSVYIIVAYITFPNLQNAQETVKELLENKLIACATMLPCHSSYWWEGKIQNDQECVVFAKMTSDKYEELVLQVKKSHPYTIPCILKFDVQADLPYAHWVADEVNKK